MYRYIFNFIFYKRLHLFLGIDKTQVFGSIGDKLEAAELGESITVNDDKFGGSFKFSRFDGTANMYKHSSREGSWVYYDEAYGKWMMGGGPDGLKAVDCDNLPVCL